MKIVIVDDSRVIRIIIEKTVVSMGYEAIHASHGQEALDLVKKNAKEVGMVILDWNMPVLNGWETLKALKKDKDFEHICILMVSTESEKEKIQKAMAAGAHGYITKPFSPEKLTEEIKRIFERARSN